MQYLYSAFKKDGQTISACIDAGSITEARKKISDLGLSIISLKIQDHKKRQDIFANIIIGWVKKIDIALFVKNFSVMIKSGLTIPEALDISISQANGKLKKILQAVYQAVQQGNSLADGLAKFPNQFKEFYIDVVRVGETAGSLEGNLNHLSLQIEKEITLKRKIKAALIYPIFVLLSTFILGIVLATFVLPRLAKLLYSLDVELPLPTRIILWVSKVFQLYGLWISLGIIFIVVAGYFILRIKFIKPFWHMLLIFFPLAGSTTKTYNLARFNRNLYVLLKSGLPINESITSLMRVMDNAVYRRALQDCKKSIEQGKSLADALGKHPNLFPPMVVRMINVGEKSGRLEEILAYLSVFYEDELENVTKNLSSIIEPLLLVAIGLIVGFVGLSIITPIYRITGSVSPNMK